MWTEELFGTNKPVIAMCHLMALPGDPSFNKEAGMREVVDWARRDFLALQSGGVDAVMFSNEFSRPYLTKVQPVTVAAMGRVIGELLSDISIAFGVDVLWDPLRSLDLAAAVGASFVREIFSGVYASDFGLWDTNTGQAVRHQHAVGAENVRLLFNIIPEAAVYLQERDITEIARSSVFNHRPDALCVSGLTAGVRTDTEVLRRVKDAVPGTVVFANTGVTPDNVKEQFAVADGAVVGTTFKKDGKFENHIDADRVKALMDKVRSIRKK